MNYTEGDPHELRQKFWHALEHSPYVMLQLDADADSAAPMTASLDEHANHAIWFFAARDSRFATHGAATATFSSKGHDLFARFAGTLSKETDQARLDKQWSNPVQAWFAGGKTDPNLLFLRMDLGPASIWSSELGLIGTAKMLAGMDVSSDIKSQHIETTI